MRNILLADICLVCSIVDDDCSDLICVIYEADQELMKDDEIKIPVQINGKTKEVIEVPADISKEDAIVAGKEAIADKINGNIVKEIYVPGRIINLVVK